MTSWVRGVVVGVGMVLTAGLSACGDLTAPASTTRTVTATSGASEGSGDSATDAQSQASGGSQSGVNKPGQGADSDGAPGSTSNSTEGKSAAEGSGNGGASSSGSGGSPSDREGGRGAGQGKGASYRVVSVVDGDTIKVMIDGRKETIRLIGLDTPETKKPNTPVQCYGKEASSHMQSLVQSKDVQLEADGSQGERDKYGRLLRYVFVGGGNNVALAQIAGGFGREYTYDGAYRYQGQFQSAQVAAQTAKRGLWGPPCNGATDGTAPAATTPSSRMTSPTAPSSSAAPSASTRPATPTVTSQAPSRPTSTPVIPAPAPSQPASSGADGCAIKGNINSEGEKIAHAPGSATYERTRISQPGERYFCSADEAIAAGWRMAAD